MPLSSVCAPFNVRWFFSSSINTTFFPFLVWYFLWVWTGHEKAKLWRDEDHRKGEISGVNRDTLPPRSLASHRISKLQNADPTMHFLDIISPTLGCHSRDYLNINAAGSMFDFHGGWTPPPHPKITADGIPRSKNIKGWRRHKHSILICGVFRRTP